LKVIFYELLAKITHFVIPGRPRTRSGVARNASLAAMLAYKGCIRSEERIFPAAIYDHPLGEGAALG